MRVSQFAQDARAAADVVRVAARWFVAHANLILAVSFVGFGLVSTALMSVEMPPYQNADEINHFFRAEQISRLGLLPSRLALGTAGGLADVGIAMTAVQINAIPFHPETKITVGEYHSMDTIKWGKVRYLASFPNTALYPPLFYLPAATSILVGKATRLTVIQTLYVARIATGICAVLLSAIAIAIAADTAPWLYAVLTLPMALSLYAAVSQDALMFATTALAAALLSASVQNGRPMSTRRFVVLCVALSLVCSSRPPYLPAALLLLLLPDHTWRREGVGIAAIAALTVAWSLCALLLIGVHVAPQQSHIEPASQLAGLLLHPLQVVHVIAATLSIYGSGYVEQIIGRPGWLDVELPPGYRPFALIVLGLAALCCVWTRPQRRLKTLLDAGLTIAVLVVSVLSIFAIQFLVYSTVGSPTVEGVQGRYFIPLILLASVAFASQSRISDVEWVALPLVLILSFPIVSIAILVRAVVLRYYLG